MLHRRTSKCQNVKANFSEAVVSPKKNLGFLPLHQMLKFYTGLRKEMKLSPLLVREVPTYILSFILPTFEFVTPDIIRILLYKMDFVSFSRFSCFWPIMFILVARYCTTTWQTLQIAYPALPFQIPLSCLPPTKAAKKARYLCPQTTWQLGVVM